MSAPAPAVPGQVNNAYGDNTTIHYNAAPAATPAESSSVATAVPVAAAAAAPAPAPKRKRAKGTIAPHASAVDSAYSKLFQNVPLPQGSCHGLKMYVYDLPEYVVVDTLNDATRAIGIDCLLGHCNASFGSSMYTYTGELFVLRRLLAQCTRVRRPLLADFFLVPFPLSVWRVAGWYGKRSVPKVLKVLAEHLVHMSNATAHKHVFLDTNDALFLMHSENLPHINRAIVVHLGPDFWSGRMRDPWTLVRQELFERSIIAPYRSHVSEDCWRPEADRPVAMFGALNTKRHPIRIMLIGHFAAQGDPATHVKPMSDFAELSDTAAWMQRSKYCLAPAGDTPSVTQRFVSAVACGCVPVFLDPYTRIGASEDSNPALSATFPLHRTIDWSHAAVRASATFWKTPSSRLVPVGGSARMWSVPKKLSRRVTYNLQRLDDASQGVLDEMHILLKL